MNPTDAVMPVESAALTGGLFVAIDIIKTTFNLTGNTRAVRLIVFTLAQVFAFADAFGGQASSPKLSLYLIGSTALRGLLMAGTALGIHELRTPSSAPGTVAGVVGALGDATAAAGKAGAALDSVAADVQGVAGIAADTSAISADLKSGNTAGAIAGAVTAAPLIESEISAALPILTNVFGLKTTDAVALATQNPAVVRSMVANATAASAAPVAPVAPSIPFISGLSIASTDTSTDASVPDPLAGITDAKAAVAAGLLKIPATVAVGNDSPPAAAPLSGLVGGDRNANIPE